VRNGGGTESRSPSIGCGIAVDAAMPDEYVLELDPVNSPLISRPR